MKRQSVIRAAALPVPRKLSLRSSTTTRGDNRASDREQSGDMGDKGNALRNLYCLSFANFVGSINETLTQGLPYLQQILGLIFWILVLYASCFIPPVLRVGRTPDMVAAFAFFSFVVLSVAWSNHSSDSVMNLSRC